MTRGTCPLRSAPQDAVGGQATDARVTTNPNRISAGDYNRARSILIGAGSVIASKTHPAHGVSDVPVRYGTAMLACSRDEFRYTDRNEHLQRSGMTPYHWVAIHDAALAMGINRW
ncbi:hypothetical protein [Streptomyces sp. NPDC054765]